MPELFIEASAAAESIGSGHLELDGRWLAETLREKCPRFQRAVRDGKRIGKLVSTPIAAESGYMSLVFRYDVHFVAQPNGQAGGEEEVLVYCLKEPRWERMSEVMKIDFYSHLIEVHGGECNFYELFDRPPAGVKMPRVHAFKRLTADDRKGYLLMDFAGDGNCRSLPLQDSLTVEQVLSIAEQIARFHAHAWKRRADWEADARFNPVNIVAQDEEMAREVFQRIHGRLRKYTDEDILRRLDELKGLMDNHEVYCYAVNDAHLEAGVPSIMSHGDLWSNNILFETNAAGELTNEVGGLIDWQAANAGNPAQDLVRVMLMNMDAEVRRAEDRRVFAFYHQKLAEYLGEQPPFSLEQLEAAARPYFVYQLALLMFITAHNFEADEQKTQRLVFTERLRSALDDAANWILPTYFSRWAKKSRD
ncbi:hypothetical protein M3Y99_01921700 [Aphelenchoides fujianensis]|nr:hypothetical protein M3Y99_01921700 [Aphelenchoides fujianensis]